MTEGERPTRFRLPRLAASLANPNIRRYLIGQQLSNGGLWMQQTAELWLILELTGSGTALGLHAVFRFGPLLLFGAHGGLVGDRFPRLRTLTITQTLHALGASVLVFVALSPDPSLAVIYAVGLFQGSVNAIDNPLRRTFIRDLASDAELPNAVALNSTMATVTRTLGPAVAGLTIALVGVVGCFAVNTLSYGAVLIALSRLDRSTMRPPTFAPKGRGQVRAGLSYAWGDLPIRRTLAVSGVVGIFAWNYNTIMPVYATTALGGGASLYGYLLSIVGVGSFVGALVAARAVGRHDARLVASMGLLVVALVSVALAPGIVAASVSLLLLGAAGTSVVIASQTRLQLRARDEMAGRIMALFSVLFVGSKPIGGALGGWLIDLSGPRLAFAFGAVVIGVAGLWLLVSRWAARRSERRSVRTSTDEAIGYRTPRTPAPYPEPKAQ